MSERYDVFLSYSTDDVVAARLLRVQLKQAGLKVFWDRESIQASDRWVDLLQEAVDACGAFVVLVGRNGVRRWVGAETHAALNRHYSPHADRDRLPLFVILLPGANTDDLPAFLREHQNRRWDGESALPDDFIQKIKDRRLDAPDVPLIEGCPFVGLDAFRMDQAHLFFGRQKETLEALDCFDWYKTARPFRWLEIGGNSGSGKSSLMQAGLLPLIDQGWLWPRTRLDYWRRIGPMMPGMKPVEMLAESLARAFKEEMTDIVAALGKSEDALRHWLRGRKEDDTAFLLAIDQFEELFTVAAPEERRRFDGLLAAALADTDCPLFMISTVRLDFLHQFPEDLPRLVETRNRIAKQWTLAPIGEDALREVIEGPARLAALDVSEVTELILADARDEPGALPLVENALSRLWELREGNRLSGRVFTEKGGLAGMLSRGADALLDTLAAEGKRERALELLLQLVRVDLDGSRHARRRLSFKAAVAAAGGGETGRDVVGRLAGTRDVEHPQAEGPVRLITIQEGDEGRTVNLIHETLIRAKTIEASDELQPYWPTLWDYIERHKERIAWRERIAADTRVWLERDRDPSHQWSHERVREAVAILGRNGAFAGLSAEERAFLGPVDPDAMLGELDDTQTTHKRRLLIGGRLAILGDPRPGTGAPGGTPEIVWHAVDGGRVEILIREDPRVTNSKIVKRMPKTVKAFHIARYPVTVAQYRAFMEADDGWRNTTWWGKDLYRDEAGNTYEFGRFGNHPALYVNWFDAVAFCRWLTHRLGFEIRLPDEWEWQQAGGGANDFPWGPDWDAEHEPYRANTFESRLGQPTAVGMYPAGAAPCGALDMGGTVWEWGLNKFDKPGETKSGSRDSGSRVLRGGSWSNLLDSARVANRRWYRPDGRDGTVGFRVVCSSPSPDR